MNEFDQQCIAEFAETLQKGDFLAHKDTGKSNTFQAINYPDVWVIDYQSDNAIICRDEHGKEYTYVLSYVWWVYTNGYCNSIDGNIARCLNNLVHGVDV